MGGRSAPCGFCEIWFHTNSCDGMTEAFKEPCNAINRIYGSSAILCVLCRKNGGKNERIIPGVIQANQHAGCKGDHSREADHKVLLEKIKKMKSKMDQVKEQVGGIEKETEDGQ